MNDPTSRERRRLVAVSNRLPVVVEPDGEGWTIRPGSGGLVTALAPVLRHRGGMWVGWAGTTAPIDLGALLGPASVETGYDLHPIPLTAEQESLFYGGFCNEVLWPLFHDLQSRCNYVPAYWRAYLEVNRLYAGLVAARTRPRDFIWVHDYHLIPLGATLRELGIGQKMAFFLHTPFPPLDILMKLPWRGQIVRSLLEYDLVGFQTLRDRRNFLHCVTHFWPELRTTGRGQVLTLRLGEREVRIGSFPIGIDFEEFSGGAKKREVSEAAWYLHEKYADKKLILGVDRLDYTKGIPLRLEAFRTALRLYPELRGQVTMFQIVVPSRASVPEYQALKEEIEGLVGQINGEFADPGWVPIHHFYRSLSREELLSYYRACEIALVTPLKDGMNLVAKEYAAASVEEAGVLILSEFAGAAAQLHRGALIVNPNDVEATAAAIRDAVRMPGDEQRRRMRRLRDNVMRHDIYRWVDSFLQAALARHLADFPHIEEYRPEIARGPFDAGHHEESSNISPSS